MSYQYQFNYREDDTKPLAGLPQRLSALRPVIDIHLINKKYPRKRQAVQALVDSGADLCLFDAELADLIGLIVEQGEKLRFGELG